MGFRNIGKKRLPPMASTLTTARRRPWASSDILALSKSDLSSCVGHALQLPRSDPKSYSQPLLHSGFPPQMGPGNGKNSRCCALYYSTIALAMFGIGMFSKTTANM